MPENTVIQLSSSLQDSERVYRMSSLSFSLQESERVYRMSSLSRGAPPGLLLTPARTMQRKLKQQALSCRNETNSHSKYSGQAHA